MDFSEVDGMLHLFAPQAPRGDPRDAVVSAGEVDRYDVAVGLTTVAMHVGATGDIESTSGSVKAVLGHLQNLVPAARAAYLELYLGTSVQLTAILAEYAARRLGESADEFWRVFLQHEVPAAPEV